METNQIKNKISKLGFYRFGKLNNKYLITNEAGRFILLNPKEFDDLKNGNLKKETKLYNDLRNNYFLNNDETIELITRKYRQRNNSLFQGTSLHIVIPTIRCNYNCVYCQASSKNIKAKNSDMNKDTAKKTVDFIFSSPSKTITIEFQGGEPLLNWPIVKFIIEYAKEKNLGAKKNLIITLVSNLSLLDEDKYSFFKKHNVSISTSFDGPELIHNTNRVWLKNNSYRATVKWINRIKKDRPIGALVTITKLSLKYPKEIIDEYIKQGFNEIHLRPLSFLGLSGKIKDEIGYSAEDFLKFWRKSMDYIIDLNIKNKYISERSSKIILKKILTDNDANYLDLRSPCGAAIGQLAYNFDGKIYTCDEGRMLQDDTFLLGDVNKNYKEIMSNPTVATVCMASILENLTCDYCVYKPYCGTCPVQNYALYGNLFPPMTNNDRCKIQKGMFEYLFKKIQDKKVMEIFKKWV